MPPRSLLMRLYAFSWKALRRIFVFIDACFTGFWLGLFSRETLYALDARYYSQTKKYHTEAYNRQGLWPWEKRMVDTYFQEARSLLVGGVGGGREVLALRQLGYNVDGFECHPRLVACANALLSQDGFPPTIQEVPRDQCPEGPKVYDGVIIGWGAYMLIRGRDRRIAFLKHLRARMRGQAPILLSFYARSGRERRFRLIASIGTIIGTVLRRGAVQPGDALNPNYVHFFTEEEVASELHEGGFTLAFYSAAEYGHAVGMASDT